MEEPPAWVPSVRVLVILSCAAYSVLEASRNSSLWTLSTPLSSLNSTLGHKGSPGAGSPAAATSSAAFGGAGLPVGATLTASPTPVSTPTCSPTGTSTPSSTPTGTLSPSADASPVWPCDPDAVQPRPWFRPRGLSCGADFPGSQSPPVPLEDAAADLPPQSEIPLYITSNNNPTFLWYWLRLTECYGIPLRIYDQQSTFPPLLALLRDIEAGGPRYSHVRLVRNEVNRGPRFFHEEDMLKQYPPYYAITDPDLVMRPYLPSNWLRVMARISQHTHLSRVSSALDITCPADMWRVPYHVGMLVEVWESGFWKARFAPEEMPPELANLSSVAWVGGVDTTLAVYHPTPPPYDGRDGMRIGGAYMAAHVPWYSYFLDLLMPGELQAQYLRGSTLDVGSTIGKMMIRNGIIAGDSLTYEPSEWNVSYAPGSAWEHIATSKPAATPAASP